MKTLQKYIKESIQGYHLKKKSCSCGCNTCDDKPALLAPILNESLAPRAILSEGLKYHIDNNKPLTEHVYRAGSKNYFDLWAEARALYSRGIIDIKNQDDLEILTETQLGEFGLYEGKKVPLDFIMEEIEWPEEVMSRHGDIIFKLSKVLLDGGAKYDLIDKETGKIWEPGGRAYKNIEKLLDDADDTIMPQGGTRSTYLGETTKAKKNTHEITLTFENSKLLDRFKAIPTFSKMLAPNQMKSLNVGNNNLTVNNVSLNGLERMESMGLYKISKKLKEEEEEFPFEYKGFKYNIKVSSNITNDRGQKLYKISIDGVGSYDKYTNEREAHIYAKREIDDQVIFEAKTKPKKKTPPIGKPKRGGSKKFYVYVRKPGGGIKKVSFGDTTGLSAKINNPEARRAFAKRHRCGTGEPKTSARYWSCRLPRFSKLLGLKGSFSGFW
jgi:hypothetical protein